mmetsp:Transcript_102143/g.264492  ORF Transcript_102143/g.264492 Transcript_102143/m.264492 type:complete len:552 (-) Transcript_102143:228-1883(-)
MRVAACFFVALGVSVSAAPPPNILYILLDDFGWADAGWHRPPNYTEVLTPNMEALIHEGIELDRHYAFKYCSPTRSAIQSGRNPVHVNVLNILDSTYNPKDPVSGFAEMPRNMTGIAEHLLRAGYETHMYGKWHAGMATPQHTPLGRGYQQSLVYLQGSCDYWTSHAGKCLTWGKRVGVVDLWENDRPAFGQNNTPTCSQEQQTGCTYLDELFASRVFKAIDSHNPAKPFFIFWAPHIVHIPYQLPEDALKPFAFIDDTGRRFYHAMVYWVDQKIGVAAQKLKDRGLWDNTLVIVHADNGGPIWTGNAGNNFPLKGGKRSNWEGGIRVNAFVSGGLLPKEVRGSKQEGFVFAWDWYATIAALAGVDPTDHRAALAGLPPVDSRNMWPLLSGRVTHSPRTELVIGDTALTDPHVNSATRVGGIIQGRYKLLVGELSMAGWTGPKFPNVTSDWNPTKTWQTCGTDIKSGCLFDIFDDPTEHHNLASEKPELFGSMLARVQELQKGVFSPHRGLPHMFEACHHALHTYGGFWGPFVGVENATTSSVRADEVFVV